MSELKHLVCIKHGSRGAEDTCKPCEEHRRKDTYATIADLRRQLEEANVTIADLRRRNAALLDERGDMATEYAREVGRLREAIEWTMQGDYCAHVCAGEQRCQDSVAAEDCVTCGLREAIGQVPAEECIMRFAALNEKGNDDEQE